MAEHPIHTSPDAANSGDPRVFMGNVGAFTKWIEGTPRTESPLEYLVVLNDILLGVARSALFLTGGASSDDESLENQYYVSSQECDELRDKLDAYLEPLIVQAKKQNQDYEPHFTIIHLLTNDLAETHQELATGFRIWWSGHPDGKDEALWTWNLQKWHWHEHLYRALFGICLVRFANSEDGICEAGVQESRP